MLTFAVPSALGHAAARAPQRLRRLLRPIGKANNLNEIRLGSMGDGRSDDAADLHYDRHSENGERAAKVKTSRENMS
jgi:hypothetical protein